jgi:hypothetical protein
VGLFDNRFDMDETADIAYACSPDTNLPKPYTMMISLVGQKLSEALACHDADSIYGVECSVVPKMTATNDGVKLSLNIDGSYVVDDTDDAGSCLEIPFRCGEVSIMGMWKERLTPEGNGDGNTAGWDWR